MPLLLNAQTNYITGLEQRWYNDPTDWIVATDSLDGELKMRWRTPPDKTEWEYSLDKATFGTIKRKWKDDPTAWELVASTGEIVTARTLWGADLSEWRVTDNQQSVELKSYYKNDPNVWYLADYKCGKFTIHTPVNNDFRVWRVDNTDECMSPSVQLFLVFLAMFHSKR